MPRPTIAALALISILAAACSSGGGATTRPSGPAATPTAPATPTAGSSAAASGPTAASGLQIVAMGMFHKVGAEVSGTVQLKHLADGSFAVVFEDFNADSADHRNVYLVSNVDVTKDADVDPSKVVDLGPLIGTEGMQDYKVPADMAANAMTYHTVVLWDTAMMHALAAAPLMGQ